MGESLRGSRTRRRCGSGSATGVPDFGHLQVEVTFTDPGAFAKPWGFTVNMVTGRPIRNMLEAVCERSSEDWPGSLSDAANRAVSVPPGVLAGYVGVYTGIYAGNERRYEVSLTGGQLIATIVGPLRRESASVPRASTRARRGRWCHNRRRCSKAWDSVTGSLSTTRVWPQTSW